jgi:hypothetical protein
MCTCVYECECMTDRIGTPFDANMLAMMAAFSSMPVCVCMCVCMSTCMYVCMSVNTWPIG